MKTEEFGERLTERGLDRAAVPASAAVFERALALFRRRTSSPPALACWVPGRLEVFGKHTDYAGGRSLVSALPRGLAFLAAPRPDSTVHVSDAVTGEAAAFDSDVEPLIPGWPRYASVAVSRLSRNFPGARRGAEIVFGSNLPQAAGMSSSSALVVGIAAALTRLWALGTRADWRRSVPDALSRAVYYASIENGRPFGDLAGDAGVGTQGGSEDHAAMLLAASGQVSAFSFVPLRRAGLARVPADWRFVVATSGVTAEKTGPARDAYNRAAAGAAALLQIWNALFEPAASLGAALASESTAVARLRRALRTARMPGWTVGQLERRLDHFLRENGRTPEALGAFHEADRARLARLAAGSQEDAEQLLRNQVPETVGLVRAARERGAFAASSFGAGFGGSVWALVEDGQADKFTAEWLRAYASPLPGVVAFVATPGPPLVELIGTFDDS